MNDKIKYIIKAHINVNQKYDGLPYTVHLKGVANIGKQFKHLIDEEIRDLVILACWGHDLIEDTHETYSDVKNKLGEFVANIIFNVSNEKGKTRKERANDKYYNDIKNDKYALFVKLCDRIANMRYSKLYGNRSMFEKYKKEYPDFKEKLYNGLYDEMWKMLDEIDFTEDDEMYYNTIQKIDRTNIFKIRLPTPIPGSLYKELFSKGVIRKQHLIEGKYYFGNCRNASVAVWNGKTFTYMRSKFGFRFPENINHLEDDDGFDLFIPIEIVNPTENEKVIYN